MNRDEFLASDFYKDNRANCSLSDKCEVGALLRGHMRAMLNDAKVRYPNITITNIETKHWLSSTFSFRLEGHAHDILRLLDSFREHMEQYV